MAAPRWPWIFAVLALAGVLAGLAGADVALMRVQASQGDPLRLLVLLLDHATLKIFNDAVLPVLLILIGFALRTRWLPARAILFIGVVQGVVTAICDGAKPLFGRLRPEVAIASGVDDRWFAGGYSFLSGHTGFYAGLFFPIVLLFPRSWPLLALPLLVAVQRMTSFSHHLSDVSGSLLVAALATIVAARYRPAGSRSTMTIER